jgi:hypothetical protein
VGNGEKDHQDLTVRNLRGIESDGDRFGMTGKSAADHFVGWRIDPTARISSRNGAHALEVFKDRLHAPETPTSQNGSLLGFAGG